tara:strand:+ start:7397 stop:7957 length:561 start_codon:yes stop_codon:yes gene_type:complete
MGRLYPKGTSLATILNNRKKAEKEATEKKKKESDKAQKIANKKRHGFDITGMSNDQIIAKMLDNQEKHYNKINETMDDINTADSDVVKRRKQNVLNNAYKNLLDYSQVLDSLQNTDENYKNAIESIYNSLEDEEWPTKMKKFKKHLNKKSVVPSEDGSFQAQDSTSTKPPSKKEKRIDELLKIIGK